MQFVRCVVTEYQIMRRSAHTQCEHIKHVIAVEQKEKNLKQDSSKHYNTNH